MKDTADKFQKKLDAKHNTFISSLDRLRTNILKQREVHERSLIESPSYELNRRTRAVHTVERDYKIMLERYNVAKSSIDKHFDKRIQNAIERLNEEREEKKQEVEKEYMGENGSNGKLARAKEHCESCIENLAIERSKKPKQLLSLEFDYKKVLDDYYKEYKEKPPFYFNFLENNELSKEAQEEKPEEETVSDSVIETLRLLAQVQQQQQEALQRTLQIKQEEESSYSNARTVYGDISQLEKEKVQAPPPAPVQLPSTEKKKKVSVAARKLEEKSGVHTYALPK